MSEEEKKVDEQPEKEFDLVNVPTGQALAIETPEGDVISTEDALVIILNKLKKLEKAIA